MQKNGRELNGWVIELYKVEVTVPPGLLTHAITTDNLSYNITLVATQITKDMDLNGDGIINPITESGLYWFPGVGPGIYIVREVLQDGWDQTFPPEKKVNLPNGYSKNGMYLLNVESEGTVT